jgi:hypothetical protein
MSNSSSQDVTEKKKKDVWQEAGGEFYLESYPSGSGQQERPGNHRKSSRLNIPLPSQTARRNSYAYSSKTPSLDHLVKFRSSLIHSSLPVSKEEETRTQPMAGREP